MAKSKHEKQVEKTVKWAEKQASAVKSEAESEPAKPEFTHQITAGPQGHNFAIPEMTHKAETSGKSFAFTNKVGRPTKYQVVYNDMAKKAASLGATDLDLAELFGVSESTIYLWKTENPKFSESIKAGKAMIDDMVEKSLLNRALGITVKETKVFCYEGAIITEDVEKYFPPDVAAQKHWLNNRRPKEWRDKREVDFTSPLTIVMDDLDQGTL